MEWLGMFCDGVVLAAAVLVAIKTIAEMIGKPIRLVRNRANDDFKARVVAILEEVLPDILYNHDLETRDRYKSDRERYLQEIKQEVVNQIDSQLRQVNVLTTQYEALAISAKDVLREKIVAMYENNKDRRKLKFFEKEALTQYYKDYKKMGGNSYIDRIYGRMVTWPVEEDDYE
jgi:regulator of replication initiation timing